MESDTTRVPELATLLRTVRHLTICFGELKSSASQIAETISAVDRGYFSSMEDEQVQSLLVTYWQTRAAALDLVQDLRQRQPPEEPTRSLYFLLGFSTALLLVDGARFLAEQVDGRPVVRRKLNQPVPTFQMPGGSYDSIQRSLVSARHAWHLYHAREYYRRYEADLWRHAGDAGMEDIAGTIQNLWKRIEVSTVDFTRYSLRTRGDQTFRRVGRSLFMQAIYGMQKLGSEMMADVYVHPGHRPLIPPSIVNELADLVAPGDVFVVRKEYALTNYFLPGYWPHAALYLGTPDQLTRMGLDQRDAFHSRWKTILRRTLQSGHCVLEAMKDGVQLRCWRSPLASDSFVLLRPRLETPLIADALARGLIHEGKGYDFDFDFGRSDRLVCTEVVYRAYDGIGDMRFELTHRAGRPTLSGGDLVQMAVAGQQWYPVAAYVPAKQAELQQGDQASVLIEQALASR